MGWRLGRAGRITFSAVMASLAMTTASPAQSLLESSPLEPGPGLTGVTLNPGQMRRFRLEVPGGHWLVVEATQHELHLILKLRARDGRLVRVVDRWTSSGQGGQQVLSLRDEPPGVYELSVVRVDEDSTLGAFDLRITDLQPMAARLAAEAAASGRRADTAAVVTPWLRERLVPVAPATSSGDWSDLEGIRPALASARLVALGEATHGTREFFQFKHRMLRYLVEHLGFTIFAMEAQWPTTFRVNEFVLGGPGDVDRIVRGMMQWGHSTEEVRDLVLWMRDYNATASPDRKVRFYGFDIQFVPRSAKMVQRFLERQAPDFAPRSAGLLGAAGLDSAAYLALWEQGATDTGATRARTVLNQGLSEVIAFLTSNRPRLVRASSEREVGEALLSAQSLLWSQLAHAGITAWHDNTRERYMAQFVEAILAANPGARMVLWAHNAHIARDELEGSGTFVPMGDLLGRRLGPAYYAVCFAFNRGAFQAVNSYPELRPGPGSGIQEFSLPAAAEGTLEWYLTLPGVPSYLLDLHAPPVAVAPWLMTNHPFRHIGSVFHEGGDPDYQGRITLARACDGLFYVDRTERARPLPQVSPRMTHFSP